ncbi:hypothetical protein Tco_0955925 [Tanacetum coccineum]|uniref:Uncharacterized protein n=1 Tax=Tanacetum coccineum TaxID=301880 RepID=A0ABQ5E8M9_9ASTR
MQNASSCSGRDYDLEDDHMDTVPSENTSKIQVEPEIWVIIGIKSCPRGILEKPANYKLPKLDLIRIYQVAVGEQRQMCGLLKLGRSISTESRKLHWFAVKHISKVSEDTKDMFLGVRRIQITDTLRLQAAADGGAKKHENPFACMQRIEYMAA